MPFITGKTITEIFRKRVEATPDLVGFEFKPTHPEMGIVNRWKQVTYQAFYDECRLVSFGLMSLGIHPGDRIVILANTRYEWSLCDLASLGAQAITVPIYPSNTADDAAYILNHSEARIAIVEDAKQLQKITEKRASDSNSLPFLEKIVVIEPASMAFVSPQEPTFRSLMTLQALKELGRRLYAQESERFDANLAGARPDDVISICYTSGTTGVPKGAMITHDNIVSVLEDCVSALSKYTRPENEVTLSFLPFSHILGKVESMAGYTFGWRAAFAENIDKLITNMGEVKPTLIFAVPRVFEKAYARIKATVDTRPPASQRLFEWACQSGSDYYSAIWQDQTPSLKTVGEYSLAKALVFRKIADRFGGRLRFAVCGGAPLSQDIAEFFQIIGLKILEGYGLTETCGPVTCNTPDQLRLGTVGRPLPEVTLKIAEDGEILVKSRKVCHGYYKMPQESEEAIVGGWFHTGDIGFLDNQGFLHITDRKKDLIVTSGGKNVAPQKIENLAKGYKMISQFVVQGDRKNYLTALVTLNREQVIRFASENNILFSEYPELIRNHKIIALVQKMIDEINRRMASFETIKKFLILPNEFTVESGELTPSLKIRRSFIRQRYKSELDSLYSESQSPLLTRPARFDS